MMAYEGSRSVTPLIGNLSTRSKGTVKFTPLPLYLREKGLQYNWIRGSSRNRTRFINRPAYILSTMPAEWPSLFVTQIKKSSIWSSLSGFAEYSIFVVCDTVLPGKEDIIDLIFRVTQSQQSLPWTLIELMDADVLISPETSPTRRNFP
jgi:hypothetical protein